MHDQAQLGVFFHHRDDLAAQLVGQHGHLDVLVVLEAVADDGRVVIGESHDGHQLGFRARFEPELEGTPELEHLLDDLALLVDLDRINAAVVGLILVLGDGGGEGVVNLAQPVLEDVGEANQEGDRNPAQDQRIDQLLQIDGAGGVLGRMDADVSQIVDREIALAPTGDVVHLAGVLRGPPLDRVQHHRSLSAVSIQRAP